MTVREAFSIAANEVQTCSTLARDPGSAPSSLVPRSVADGLAEAVSKALSGSPTTAYLALEDYRANYPREETP